MENKTRNSPEYHSSGTRKTVGTGAIIFLSILALLLAIGGALLLREVLHARYEAQVKDLMVQTVTDERNQMVQQLDELEAQYSQLTAEHEELEGQFRAQQVRVNQLRAQLRAGGGSSAEVEGYKAQIADLEAQLEEYRQQFDLLEAENIVLGNETSQMRASLAQTTSRNTELEMKAQELETQLEKASVLTISGLEGTALRSRRRGDQPTDRARRTDKIRICFTVNQNLVAPSGNTDFLIRLVDPNNRVMTTSPDNTLEFEGETIQYSLRRTINYQNDSQDICVVWDQVERFERGYYNIVVFWEGNEVGYKLFELN